MTRHRVRENGSASNTRSGYALRSRGRERIPICAPRISGAPDFSMQRCRREPRAETVEGLELPDDIRGLRPGDERRALLVVHAVRRELGVEGLELRREDVVQLPAEEVEQRV